MLQVLLSFTWSLLVSMFAVPTVINVAHTKQLLDQPNHRKVHRSEKPRLGGIAMYTGFATALTIFGVIESNIQQLLAGSLVIFLVGVKDDIMEVSVFKKFFVQVLACGIVMYVGDIRITSFQGLFGIYELDDGISYAFTFLVILGITNALNLIDGLDGLAGTIILITSIAFGVYFIQYDMAYAFVAFSLAGAVIGFLRYNFHNASVFMGDTGSLVSGFILSILAIRFIELGAVPASPAIAVAILFVPIFDTLRVFCIRIFNGISPFTPDKRHIHHALLNIGLTQLKIVFSLALFNLIMIIFVLTFARLGNTMLLLAMGAIGLCFNVLLEVGMKRTPSEINV